MEGQMLLYVKLVIIFVGRSSAEHCDRATTAQARAGNLGQSGDFNWLGVLFVHLHDGDKIHVAMTGIVLVKIKYALANADDVVRIPQDVFKSDSKAMFIAARDTPWLAKPESFVTHPEYEYSTLNTIAIVELKNLDDVDDFPLNPICIPSGEIFNTSRHLYLTGFTDENRKMEKVIYNIQYLDKKACEEFYNRAGLSSQKRIPSEYLCGYAPNNVTQCVWDNGMVLVSNVTGYFHLIGFGIHGPGCAAPARFIDLFHYFSWINSVTSPNEYYDEVRYRREGDDEFIPIHELFTVNGSRRASSAVYKQEFERYPFDADALKHHKIRPTEYSKAILIFAFNDTWEQYENACKLPKYLMYNEYFEVKATSGTTGIAYYKLSLYDLVNTVCACVRLTVDCDDRSEAIISFKEEINYKEGIELNRHNTYKTPEELYKSYIGQIRTVKPKQSGKWEPNLALLKPAFINDDDIYFRRVLNYDLYIKFEFTERAILKFEIFAEKGPLDPNRTWPTTTTPTTITMTPATASTITPVTASTTTPAAASTTTPATASRTTPATASRTTPATASTTTPATASTTTPATASTTTPATASTTTPATASTTTPATASTTTPATASTTTPATASTTTPATASTTTPATASTTTPATASTTTPATASTTTPATASTTTPAMASTTTLAPSPPRRRANSRVQTTAKSHRGMVNWSDNKLKEVEVSLMADVEDVQETESLARSEGAAGAVVVACWLVSACLRRAFFIH